jgi:hypothetical protein
MAGGSAHHSLERTAALWCSERCWLDQRYSRLANELIDDLPIRSPLPPKHASSLQPTADLINLLSRSDSGSLRQLVVVERPRAHSEHSLNQIATSGRCHDIRSSQRQSKRECRRLVPRP